MFARSTLTMLLRITRGKSYPNLPPSVNNQLFTQRTANHALDVVENGLQGRSAGKWTAIGWRRARRTRWLSSSSARSSPSRSWSRVGPPARKTALRKWFVGKFIVTTVPKANIR